MDEHRDERPNSMTDVVIASGARTPVGSFLGSFANLPAHDLGTVAIKAALERAKVAPNEVSEVILGQILTGAQGQNPGRQASIKAGIPVDEYIAQHFSKSPAGRAGDPFEFGEACAFLCAASSGYIVGQNLLLDGGAYNATLG